ncbi:hypothetical protein [Neobacillus sp. DY30]|uniref:hypothetical protein n=1 Tax=Neobacillus sp. DY30 TaxID=3047871 RepID=UPI0024BF6DDE|nr:hypothetical protein [Neobacillus sp. DY30]WHY01811.1 hypothetical protein QNH29_06180 [Neobacillus sp. DY30]
MRLTDEHLTEIRKRVEAAERDGLGSHSDSVMRFHARKDVPKLLAEIERLKKVANDILEEYDSSERRVINEVSTDIKFALYMHEAYLRDCKNEINGVDENDGNL